MALNPTVKASAATRLPITPSPAPQASSADPPSSRPSIRTPLERSLSRHPLASVHRAASASGGRPRAAGNAPTPHARAARLALNQRRNALFTPGKTRRRSLREQRETPMHLLRNLSRALAPGSKPIVSSSPHDQDPSIAPRDDGDDNDDLPIDRPRLSLPLDHDDDDDDSFRPPRTSGLEDENFTAQSIELPRRAYNKQLGAGLSRASLDNARVSDFFNQNDRELSSETRLHSDFFPGLFEDLGARTTASDFTLDRIDMDLTRRTTVGAESDFGLERPAGLDDQTTFILSDPPDPNSPRDAGSNPAMADLMLAQDAATSPHEIHDASLAGEIDAATTQKPSDSVLQRDGADELKAKVASARKGQKRLSRHGVEYSPLPSSFVKKVAQTALHSSGLGNSRLSADTLAALAQASDWFFDQLGDDLGAYAKHAKRKTIEESDVVTLMRRQRQIGPGTSIFSLAQKHLPRELLQVLRMPPPRLMRKRRGKRAHADYGDEAGTS